MCRDEWIQCIRVAQIAFSNRLPPGPVTMNLADPCVDLRDRFDHDGSFCIVK